jgi:membrane protease YdiL (CAAX protease family)
MRNKAKIIAVTDAEGNSPATRHDGSRRRDLLEIGVVFGLIMAAIWTPQGRLNALFSVSAAGCVVAFAIAGRWTSREMGLRRLFSGAEKILLLGGVLCAVIWFLGWRLKFLGAAYPIPWSRSWQYALWALVQEFILQSIFFLRFESWLGCRRAIVCATLLYAIAHLPSPALTPLSFVGGLIFCELFRRYRNIFPLGVIHAALGITIAASLPDKWLHHMRVGIGYLTR